MISNKKGNTPTNTGLRAATRIVTTYTVNVVVVWVAYHIAPYSTKFTQSQHVFAAVTGTPAITGSFWMVTDREPAWSQL